VRLVLKDIVQNEGDFVGVILLYITTPTIASWMEKTHGHTGLD
jgi:hypothetical protein